MKQEAGGVNIRRSKGQNLMEGWGGGGGRGGMPNKAEEEGVNDFGSAQV